MILWFWLLGGADTNFPWKTAPQSDLHCVNASTIVMHFYLYQPNTAHSLHDRNSSTHRDPCSQTWWLRSITTLFCERKPVWKGSGSNRRCSVWGRLFAEGHLALTPGGPGNLFKYSLKQCVINSGLRSVELSSYLTFLFVPFNSKHPPLKLK